MALRYQPLPKHKRPSPRPTPQPHHRAFNSTAIPAFARATSDGHGAARPRPSRASADNPDLRKATIEIRNHLTRQELWSPYDGANLARFLVTQVYPGPLDSLPMLELALRFNRYAAARNAPPMALSDIIAAAAQVAAVGLLILDDKHPAMLHLLPRFHARQLPRLDVPPSDQLRAINAATSKAGIDRIAIDTADHIARIIVFIEAMLDMQEGAEMGSDQCYAAYTAWCLALNVTSLHALSFKAIFKALVTELAAAVEVISHGQEDIYKGLRL